MTQQVFFAPKFIITCDMAQDLIEIEALRQTFFFLNRNKKIQKKLLEKTKNELFYYLRLMENLHTDSKALDSYVKALNQVNSWATMGVTLSQSRIQILHALVTSQTKRSSFRDAQNAIFDSTMKKILYMPPKAQDVKKLLFELLLWLKKNQHAPRALIAGIVHFGINAIHPFYDANGRTARLLTRWILKLHNYDLDGLYCLEKYYAMNLESYYDALGLHGKKTYKEGAQVSDCTDWLAYFLQGMKQSFQDTVDFVTTP